MCYEPMGVQVFDIMFFEIVGVLESAGSNLTFCKSWVFSKSY